MKLKLTPPHFLGFLCLLFLSTSALAQLKMEKGTSNISVRLGTGFLQTSKFNTAGDAAAADFDDFKATTPAFGGGFELAFWNNIVVGADINYAKFKNDVNGNIASGTAYHSYGEMTILNFIFHVKYFTPIKISKLATYARIDALPFAVFKKNRTIDWSTGVQTFSNKNGVKMTYGIYGGADFGLTKSLGIFGEVGYGYTAVNVGTRITIGK